MEVQQDFRELLALLNAQIRRRIRPISKLSVKNEPCEMTSKKWNSAIMNAQKPKSPRKPFVFMITKEKLEKCRGMSPEAKLQWLEEANRFIYKFVSKDQLARWEKIR